MKDISLLKGKIHYVGVNDRSTHLFEGMWPLPYGVSYNSYLIVDDKVAIVEESKTVAIVTHGKHQR